jgi:hypothetical protein
MRVRERKSKGIRPAAEEMLQLMCALKPWDRGKGSETIAKYLDGDEHALDALPTLKSRIDDTISAYHVEKATEEAAAA